jgi:dTDP-4-amino-4,6-dideoxygalactose transaminase
MLFNRPYTTGREVELMLDAVARGHLSGDGHYSRLAASLLAGITGVPDVLLTTSCTHALEMAALLLDLEPGDEIILPSFTFVSTANAFVMRGAVPVFVDIKRGTNNIDEALIERSITTRTRAIVVVHYAGVSCEMDEILALGDRYGLAVIETMRMASEAVTPGANSARWGRCPPSRFTRPRTFIAARAPSSAIDRTCPVPRFCARKERTAAASFAVRSTSTHGSTSARVICRRTFSRRFSPPSWRSSPTSNDNE